MARRRPKIADNAVNGAKADEASFGNPLVRDVITVTDRDPDVGEAAGQLQVFALCPASHKMISGGVTINDDNNPADHAITDSTVGGDPGTDVGWFGQSDPMPGGTDEPYSLTGTAVCARY
jgi:hypothetical protein